MWYVDWWMLNIISRSSSPSHVKSIQLQNIINVLLPWFLITCWDNQYGTWQVTASSRGSRVVPGQCCWSPQQGWVGDPRWASGSNWRSWASWAFLCLPLSSISCELIHYFVQFFVQYFLRFSIGFYVFFWAGFARKYSRLCGRFRFFYDECRSPPCRIIPLLWLFTTGLTLQLGLEFANCW